MRIPRSVRIITLVLALVLSGCCSDCCRTEEGCWWTGHALCGCSPYGVRRDRAGNQGPDENRDRGQNQDRSRAEVGDHQEVVSCRFDNQPEEGFLVVPSETIPGACHAVAPHLALGTVTADGRVLLNARGTGQ